MDIGGRKMAGFASGVIDSFQYFGTAIALPATGWLIDHYGWGTWFPTMVLFGVIGACAMRLVMLKQRRLAALPARPGSKQGINPAQPFPSPFVTINPLTGARGSVLLAKIRLIVNLKTAPS